jgi:hypothetical protein
MLKTTDAREPHNFGVRCRPRFNRTTIWRIAQHSVNALRVATTDIVAKESAQVILIEHVDVIDEFSLTRSYPAASIWRGMCGVRRR